MTKTKHSVFYVTINSNEDMDNNKNKQEWFKKAVEYIFKERILQYIKYHHFAADNHKKEDIKNHIKSLNVKLGYESGSKLHKYHTHAIVNITHDTYLQMDNKNLREFFTKLMGHGIHLDIVGRSNNQKTIEDYVGKDGDTKEFNVI